MNDQTLAEKEGVLNSVLSWKLIPNEVYSGTPTPPSVLYGSQHLLRLFGTKCLTFLSKQYQSHFSGGGDRMTSFLLALFFIFAVKIPSLLSRMPIPDSRLKALVKHLNMFLQ